MMTDVNQIHKSCKLATRRDFLKLSAVGLAGMLSAIHQGKVCAAAALMGAKRPELVFKAGVVYAVMVETYAVLGLLVTLLLLTYGVKLGV